MKLNGIASSEDEARIETKFSEFGLLIWHSIASSEDEARIETESGYGKTR